MSTLPYLPPALQAVLEKVPNRWARRTGFVKRQSKLTGAAFVQTLTFGWLANPDATLENLAQTAASVGVAISAQGLDQRFTEPGAHLLEGCLREALRHVLVSEPAVLPLLARFTGVYLLDSTQLALPPELAPLWAGSGGGHAPTDGLAALKIQVCWEFRRGALCGLVLQAGRTSDRTSPTQDLALPTGSLRVADLGYFDLAVLAQRSRDGCFWITRRMARTQLYDGRGRALDLVRFLAQRRTPWVDCPVQVGREEHLAARLVAWRVPAAVARQRRPTLRKEARRKAQSVSPERLRLAGWTIVLTNLSVEQASPQEVSVLLHLRWQIELLFKLWKSQGHLDESRSEKPWRQLCEIYAKLLGLILQHWILLTRGWRDPARSLVKAGQVIRSQALELASAFTQGAAALRQVLEIIARGLTVGCRVNKRKNKLSAFQLWLDPQCQSLA
ncbi:MAG: IS4 family transposase [Chloroflexi bacterium]|nr:IS4 family transposase [Chloroflexota bacterium]